MHRYILERILQLIPVLLGVIFIVFITMHITPGDPALMMLGEQAPEHQLEQLRERLGLNQPIIVQYGRYVGNVVRGDFGRSLRLNTPVTSEILSRLPNTVKLSVGGVLVAMLIGIPVGIISAYKQYSFIDHAAMVGALLGVSLPNFWQGMMAILIFSVWLGVLPSSGFNTPSRMILPILTIGTSSAALITRMTRSSMLEVLRQDYIRMARAKGLSEWTVLTKHALKNALIPIVTVIGLQFGFLLGGAVLTERIFSIPGVGQMIVDAIRWHDFTLTQGGVLFVAIMFSIVNLTVDILYGFLDPRIKSQYQ